MGKIIHGIIPASIILSIVRGVTIDLAGRAGYKLYGKKIVTIV